MDPNHTGPEEYGHGGDGDTPRQRPPRESLTSDFAQHAPVPARTVQLVSGDFLLTVNPVDGSEIEPCPPAERPDPPVKLTEAERAEVERAATPPVPLARRSPRCRCWPGRTSGRTWCGCSPGAARCAWWVPEARAAPGSSTSSPRTAPTWPPTVSSA